MKLFYLLRYFLWNNFRSAVSEEYSVALELILSEYDNRAVKLLPWVHTLVANVKANIRGTYHGGISSKHFQRYLAEYCYRSNHRFWQSPTFDRILSALSCHQ